MELDLQELEIDVQVQARDGAEEIYIGQVNPKDEKRCGFGYLITSNSGETSLQEGLFEDGKPTGMTRSFSPYTHFV